MIIRRTISNEQKYLGLAERFMSEATHLPRCPVPDAAITYFYIGIIRQKVRELQPANSNLIGYDTCVMVSALNKFVLLDKNRYNRVEKVSL